MSILLEIDERFLIRGRGLILIPRLPIPTTRYFEPFDENIVVIMSDGIQKEFRANFHVEHFNFGSGNGKLSATLMFPDLSIDDIPKGSRLLISADAWNIILDPR